MRMCLEDVKISFILFLIFLVFIEYDDILAQNNENEILRRDIDSEKLEDGFNDPPDFVKPKVYWWWLNGSVDTLRLRSELNGFKKAGITGVDIFDIATPDYNDSKHIVEPGPAYMGDNFLKTMSLVNDVAGELGIEVGLSLSSSWNAGGSWVPPEHAAKSLYFTKIKVSERSNNKKHLLPFPEIRDKDEAGRTINIPLDSSGRPVFREEVAVIAVPKHKKGAYPDTSKILNLTKKFNPDNEILSWEAPEGEWDIYRYIVANSGRELKRPSPNSAGPIIDHYDADAMKFHVNYFIDRLSTVIEDISESSLTYLYLASYEARGFTWTPTLPEVFKEKHGYDVYKYIPTLQIQDSYVESAYPNDEIALQFLYDFNQTISDMMIKNHYEKGKSVANSAGLKLISEAGGPGRPMHNVPVEALGALGALDIPRGEFWYERTSFTQEGLTFSEADSIDLLQMVKGPAAAGNIYKKPQVEMEAFTSSHFWEEGPFDIKSVGDRAFAEGMNRVVVHGSNHNPSGTGYPGIAYHAGTHFNDKRVWWPKIKPFNEYLSRISYIAQQGSFYSDVLYYHGDQAPNIVRPKNRDFFVGPGYDYEVINTEILLRDLTVEDGMLKLPEVGRYQVLVLNPSDTINPFVLEKLGKLASQGAIILGKKPITIPGLGFDDWNPDVIQRNISENWISATEQSLKAKDLTRGKIIEGVSAIDVLKVLNIKPDIAYSGQELKGPLDYIHYSKGELDFYFIRNTTEEWIKKNVNFRQKNKTPELWDPVTGEQQFLPVYNRLKDQIGIPLTFKPYDSYFIVFKDENIESRWDEMSINNGEVPAFLTTSEGYIFRNEGKVKFQKNNKIAEIETNLQSFPVDSGWEVFFPENWGAPSSTILPELISWTDSENDGIKYFSGIATYHKEFEISFDPDTLSEEYKIYLSLGDLEKVGEVWLNGEALGISWTKPHEYDITNYIEPDENQLRIEVANVWANRVIGDARTGQDFTTTNITNVRGMTWEEVPLITSGLLGPVNIEIRRLFSHEE